MRFSVCTDTIDPERLKWYEARSFLFGTNYKKQNLQKALRLAQKCLWPEAQWLLAICEKNGGMPEKRTEAKAMFLKEEGNSMALGIAGIIAGRDNNLILRAAIAGDAYSQSLVCDYPTDGEQYNFVEKSAMQDDPRGLCLYGLCLYGLCRITQQEKQQEKQEKRSCLKRAIDLGDIGACYYYCTNDAEPEYFFWMGKFVANGGNVRHFCTPMMIQMKIYHAPAPVIFQIGKALVGQIDENRKTLFQQSTETKFIDEACIALKMFISSCHLTRRAVDTWTVIAFRFAICKDVRLIISHLIWESRTHFEQK